MKDKKRVGAPEAAVNADPFFEWVTVDSVRGVQRAAKSKGNTLDWKVTQRPGEPTSIEFRSTVEQTLITVVVVPTSDRPAAQSITVSNPDGGTLDENVWPALRLRGLLTEINEHLESPFLRYMAQRTGETGWADPFLATPRTGRKGRPDIEYAIWADRYVAAVEKTGGKPMPALIADFPGYTEKSIRQILYNARLKQRGLLTKSEPGKAGGDLTKKAIDLLTADGLPITSGGN